MVGLVYCITRGTDSHPVHEEAPSNPSPSELNMFWGYGSFAMLRDILVLRSLLFDSLK